ncbi:NON-STRUCTURAL MAINTENANCE OF CHROMOSOMES ELEMENT 4 [Salix purpurea]|uniref:Non-structural maintenance of chromosomes element 4 n=1 Tax=Salix purpurea TaxID=77065 RepID=A0A9Q0VX22_SALPP|nr:NON-STRUCTURAL MAINTENANCE OF CHROMOSOMES ELEMENT 4 [Salix purpurea]
MTRPVKREPHITPHPAAGGSTSSSSRLINGGAETSDMDSREATERRFLRSLYRDVKRIITDEREDVERVDSDKFNSIINQVEDLHKSVQKPREQVADAEALLDITNSLVALVKAHGNDGITPSDFVNGLLRDFGRQDGPSTSDESSRNLVAWKDIGLAVSHIFSGCPGCHTMVGPMDTELKQRKAVVGRRRTRPTGSVQPEEVNDSGGKERTDTDKNMATMFSILKNKRSVKLENLVLNRKSFAQTVENLFALSFLVKDGRAEIKVNENGWHLVSPRNAPDAGKVVSGEVAYRHFVFRFDFKDWKLMISAAEAGEELMPNRNQINMPSDSLADPVPVESQAGGPTTPIRKLSRNRGLVLQEKTIVEDPAPENDNIQLRIPAIRKGKRKMR